MSLTVHTLNGSYQFEGPYINTRNLANKSGVYVITTLMSEGLHKIVDVGESHLIKDRIFSHDRKEQWIRHQLNDLYVAALYCNEQTRMLVEQHVRTSHSPPCGVR